VYLKIIDRRSVNRQNWAPEARDLDFVALDEALKTLEQIDPRQGRIVERRCFGGWTRDRRSSRYLSGNGQARMELGKAWLDNEKNDFVPGRGLRWLPASEVPP
jgi:hypothetical protein